MSPECPRPHLLYIKKPRRSFGEFSVGSPQSRAFSRQKICPTVVPLPGIFDRFHGGIIHFRERSIKLYGHSSLPCGGNHFPSVKRREDRRSDGKLSQAWRGRIVA